MEWKPIETAPRDGTSVLVYGKNAFANSPYMGVRSWSGSQWSEPNNSAHDPDDWLDGSSGCEVTHWRMLPVAPK